MRWFSCPLGFLFPGVSVGLATAASAMITVGSVDTPGTAIDVEVVGDFAYLADHTAGFRVIDISNPKSPVIVGAVNTIFAHDIALVGNLAYAVDTRWGSGDLRVIDVSNPASPVTVGFRPASISPDAVAVLGGFAYVACQTLGLLVIDVADLASQRVQRRWHCSGEQERGCEAPSAARCRPCRRATCIRPY